MSSSSGDESMSSVPSPASYSSDSEAAFSPFAREGDFWDHEDFERLSGHVPGGADKSGGGALMDTWVEDVLMRAPVEYSSSESPDYPVPKPQKPKAKKRKAKHQRPPTPTPAIATVGTGTKHEHTALESPPIGFGEARRILSAGLGVHPPRPYRILDSVAQSNVVGCMYMDRGERRKPNGDLWKLMGGPHGGTFSKEHGIQRKYGLLTLSDSNSSTLSFHMHTLADEAGSLRGGSLRLWHIVKAPLPKQAVATPPTLTKPLRAAQRKAEWAASYIDFESEDGVFQGAIGQGDQGAVFRSKSGDVAEWIRRKPAERPFEAGDVVGFDSNGNLTRTTVGSAQIGIISRIAMVEGSVPDQKSLGEYDTVAYTGHVPVKLIGGCKAGQYIVPSGRNDGTAVAYKYGRWRAPVVRLGRAMENVSSADNQYEMKTLTAKLSGECQQIDGSSDKDAGCEWRLVETTVVSPVDSVSTGCGYWMLLPTQCTGSGSLPRKNAHYRTALGLVLVLVGLLCLRLAWCHSLQECQAAFYHKEDQWAKPPSPPASPSPPPVPSKATVVAPPLGGGDKGDTEDYSSTQYATVIGEAETVRLGAFGGVTAAEYIFQKVLLPDSTLASSMTFQSILDNQSVPTGHLLGKPCPFDPIPSGVPANQWMRTALNKTVDYHGLMVAACSSIGMKPVCNHANKCGDDPASIFLGHAGHLSNAQLYDSASNQSQFYPDPTPPGFKSTRIFKEMLKHTAGQGDGLCFFEPRDWIVTTDESGSDATCASSLVGSTAGDQWKRHMRGGHARCPFRHTRGREATPGPGLLRTPQQANPGFVCAKRVRALAQDEAPSMGPEHYAAPLTLTQTIGEPEPVHRPVVVCQADDAKRTADAFQLGEQLDSTVRGKKTYTFRVVRAQAPHKRKWYGPASAGVAAACQRVGMKPVCNNFASCGTDPASIFLGQDGTLSIRSVHTCPADFPFESSGVGVGRCFKERSAAVRGQAPCGKWCAWMPESGFGCGNSTNVLCETSDSIISPISKELSQLRLRLEMSPGGMCYYSGLDGPSGRAKLPGLCAAGTCYSSFRRPGAPRTRDCETAGGQAEGESAALCKAAWSNELLWMAPTLVDTQSRKKSHFNLLHPVAWSPNWSFLCAREVDSTSPTGVSDDHRT